MAEPFRLDFTALGTGTTIRQALEALDDRAQAEADRIALAAVEVIRERVAELEKRLNTARRTAWVAAPIAWRLVGPGDVIVGKTGHLLKVVTVERGGPWKLHIYGHRPEVWPIQTSDPDTPVPVLRRPTADALDILARQLGAQELKEEKAT
jgi:hypothetical protein